MVGLFAGSMPSQCLLYKKDCIIPALINFKERERGGGMDHKILVLLTPEAAGCCLSATRQWIKSEAR